MDNTVNQTGDKDNIQYNPEVEAKFEIILTCLKPYFKKVTILKRFYKQKILNLNFISLIKEIPNELETKQTKVNLFINYFNVDEEPLVKNDEIYAPSLVEKGYTIKPFNIKIKRYSNLLRVYII
jgi:hypothetical protein